MEQEELNKILDSLDDNAYKMIRNWLFDKANSYAPDVKALHLHTAANALIPMINKDGNKDAINDNNTIQCMGSFYTK